MTNLLPQDLVLREHYQAPLCFVCVTVFANRSTKQYYCLMGQKGEVNVANSVVIFLPNCLQEPTRLADGLGLGGALPSLGRLRPEFWIPRIRACRFRLTIN